MCHMSGVMCNLSHVTQNSKYKHMFSLFFRLSVETSRWRVCYQRDYPTRLQVPLAMARNLSIGTRCKKDYEGAFQQTDVCKERRQILTNICHVENFKSIREPYFPVEFPETRCGCSGLWFEPLSRNSWMDELDFFITTIFQTVVRGAQGHPTGDMISRFGPWPMNNSFLVSKHQTKL